MKPFLVPVVALGLVLGALPSHGAVRPRVQTLELVRTQAGPTSFRIAVQSELSDAEPHGFEGGFLVRVDRGRITQGASLGAIAFDWAAQPTLKTRVTSVDVCRPVGGCIVGRALESSAATTYSDEGEPDAFNRFYLVLEGPARVSFRAKGWVLRRVPLTYRYVMASAAQAEGAFTGTTSVEVFHSAALTGGARGSLATGTPPCSIAVNGAGPAFLPRGVGRATLTGGRQTSSLTCPTNVGQPYLTGVASRRTTWRLTGPVVGDDTMFNVPLFVLDLPSRL